MKLSYPLLSLPVAPEERAFEAVEKVLRSDPQLRSATEMFLSWRGEVEDLFEPSVSTCPFLRISPGGLPSNWETEGQHRAPLQITFEAAVVGTDHRNILRYWHAIRTALFPPRLVGDTVRSDYVRQTMQAAGIAKPILTEPAYGSVEIGEGKGSARITLATGTLQLILLISTP